jgi:hypothetical protein
MTGDVKLPAHKTGLAARAPGQQHLAQEAGEEPPDLPHFFEKIKWPLKNP